MTDEIQEFWRPQIPSKNLKIWRYIDLTQLLSILERDALWFNRVDNFEDPMEGSFTHANVETREERYKDTEIPDSALNAVSHLRKLSRKISYLNCWHVNNYESAAMWEQYSSGGQGIAIQTTIGDLIDALTEKEGVFDSKEANSKDSNEIERTITFGVVQYLSLIHI